MKVKRNKDKKKHARKLNHKETKRERSSSSSSESDEWVEKESIPKATEREDWMAMTGMLKTYTKDDIKSKKDPKEKKSIDSYNPGTSSRELNPYWKHGGTGLPQTAESFQRSKNFMKPLDDNNFYSNSSRRESKRPCDNDVYSNSSSSKEFKRPSDKEYLYSSYDKNKRHDEKDSKRKDRSRNDYGRSYNWKKGSGSQDSERNPQNEQKCNTTYESLKEVTINKESPLKSAQQEEKNDLYLSDEQMNKLGAKIVKAEIMGDRQMVEKLKAKLEAARTYRKQNPNPQEQDEGVMLMSTSSTGNSRPLTKSVQGDPRSKGGKHKAETHDFSGRIKYFRNDDKCDLKEMFQQEKYGSNYDEEAQLARVAAKHKNPNDDLEDIFVDEISKNVNEAKESEKEKQRAIQQHVKMEKSLEGCEYCVDSKNMLKHLMVSCASRVYVAVPSRKSLVNGQCIITTIQHSTCVTSVDEDVWEEILNYRKALTQFYNSQNKDVVFFETASRLHRFPHMVINCVPLPRDVGDMAAIYFKKALLECEAEWSMNAKVVDLKGKSIRKGIPKGLPYFWIDFGMDPGFAHVIEDQQLFPKNFAQEVIGGILDLDHSRWKNPQKEYGDIQRKKVLDFLKNWKQFDPITKNKD